MGIETINCKLITPMLMHGEDTGKAELRPPAIKGAMRFWWRAIHGNLTLKELKEQESKLFGGVGEDSAVRSSFRMFIKNSNIIYIKNEELYNSFSKKFNGIQYNLYSLVINKSANSIEKGSFTLSFNFRNNEYKEEVFKTLNYINFFGNFGARSRRGAGSIKFIHNELLSFSGDTKEELKVFINKNFNKDLNKTYSTFAKNIYIFDSKDNWKDALESIAKKFKDFRNLNKSKVFESPNFGFPIRHKDKSIFLGGKNVKDERGRTKCLSIERRSSPLIFKIYQSDNNKFFPMIIWLNGELLNDGYKIIKKNNCNYSKKASESIVNEFFNSFKGDEYVKW